MLNAVVHLLQLVRGFLLVMSATVGKGSPFCLLVM